MFLHLLIINLHMIMFHMSCVLTPFLVHMQNRKKRLLALAGLSICLSVHIEQLGCHWTDFHEI
jgi:hypothetical protein